MASVRLSIKAVVIESGRLLVIKNRDPDGDWYCLPGGGQEPGETILEALTRECVEEIGSEVVAGRLRFIRDYLASNHEFAEQDNDSHQVEMMFEAQPKALVPLLSSGDEADTPVDLGDVN